MIYIVLYLVGYVLTYLYVRKYNIPDRDWLEVVLAFFLALTSWLGLVLFIVSNSLGRLLDNSKPPKWL